MNYIIFKKQNKKTINKYKSKFKKSEIINFKFKKKVFKDKEKNILIKEFFIILKFILIIKVIIIKI